MWDVLTRVDLERTLVGCSVEWGLSGNKGPWKRLLRPKCDVENGQRDSSFHDDRWFCWGLTLLPVLIEKVLDA